jgi:hypothetical protein
MNFMVRITLALLACLAFNVSAASAEDFYKGKPVRLIISSESLQQPGAETQKTN